MKIRLKGYDVNTLNKKFAEKCDYVTIYDDKNTLISHITIEYSDTSDFKKKWATLVENGFKGPSITYMLTELAFDKEYKMKDDLTRFKIKALEEAAIKKGNELGEYWAALVELQPRAFNAASNKFAEAYFKEIDEQYQVLLQIQEEDEQTT